MYSYRLSIALVVALIPALSACRVAGDDPPPHTRPTMTADIRLEPETEVLTGLVPRSGTLDSLLRAHRIGDRLAPRIVDAARTVFNPRRLRAGQPYEIVVTLEGLFRRFEYEIDRDRFLRVDSAGPDESASLMAEILEYPKRRQLATARGSIEKASPSLIAAVGRKGENVELALSLANVFASQVDFNSDLQPGDEFGVLFEKEFREDKFSGYGAILAAEFVNGGRQLKAFRFEGADGRAGYYDENGRSVRRFFLSSPLPFTPRITSRFSRRRMHPVLGVPRAHLGVDYAAPTGTPVIAVADGTVVSAGMNGASGRMIRLRHSNGYQSYYLHLSAFASGIRAGARVSQGQVIGKVGASGLVTGPHLDYRLARSGTFVDPITEQRKLPPGEPVPEELFAAFEAARDRALALMRREAPDPQGVLAAVAVAVPDPSSLTGTR
jgi:murein DD-endopeptidase MepM/ murein hydrolase activator NlpD